MAEFRKNIITGKLCVIASERAKRPKMSKVEADKVNLNIAHDPNCPFCYGNENQTPLEISSYRTDNSQPNTRGWKIRVVPNKYPAFARENEFTQQIHEDFFEKTYAYGSTEIIIESPHHSMNPALFDLAQIELLISSYVDRIVDLKQDKNIKYIIPFRNNGKQAGASLAHPHSQLIAIPIIPHDLRDELVNSSAYYEENNKCVFCELIKQEQKENLRIVAETPEFIAICPFASEFSFETWILPKRHNSKFEDITNEEKTSFAKIYKQVMTKIYVGLDDIPYNYFIQSSPVQEDCADFYHWSFRVIPKFSIPAGFELGTNIAINTAIPEDCADFLKNILV